MPKGVDPNVQKAVDFLPTTGEVLYDEWKKKIADSGQYDLIPLTRTAKVVGLVKYRNQANPDGSISVMVKRI